MTPEYQFKIEGLVNKERVVGGLMDSGYILAVEKRFGDIYEVTVYGKQRVDGKGGKSTDWASTTRTTGIHDGVKITSTTKPVDAISTVTSPYVPNDHGFWKDTVYAGGIAVTGDGTTTITGGNIETRGIKESEINTTIKATKLNDAKIKEIVDKTINHTFY